MLHPIIAMISRLFHYSHTMSIFVKLSLVLLLGAQTALSTPLDDYVWAPDDNYKWEDLVSEFVVEVSHSSK